MNKLYCTLFFLCCSLGLHAQFSFTVGWPKPYQVYDTAVLVNVTVRSDTAVTSVIAAVGNRQVRLLHAYGTPTDGFYNGWLRIADLPVDTLELRIAATDVLQRTGEVIVPIEHDPGPRLIPEAPLNYGLANPLMHLKARATDNGSVKRMIVFYGESVDSLYRKFAVPGDRIDTTLPASSAGYTLAAEDNRGQLTAIKVRSLSENSAYLTPFFAAMNGTIWDFKYNKALVQEDHNTNLRITDVHSGATTVIPFGKRIVRTSISERAGWLIPDGAVFTAAADSLPNKLEVYLWRGGILTLLSPAADYAKANGYYAIWRNADSLYLTDVRNLQPVLVDNFVYDGDNYAAGMENGNQAALAENGLVAYVKQKRTSSEYAVYQYHNGVKTKIAGGGSGTYISGFYDLQTDGQKVAYVEENNHYYYLESYVSEYDGSAVTRIHLMDRDQADYDNRLKIERNSRRVRVNNGYVAFATRALDLINTSDPVKTVAVRDPRGNNKGVFTARGSKYSESISLPILGLSGEGETIFWAWGDNTLSGAYHADTAGRITRISDNQPDYAYAQNGEWYVSQKNLLFRLRLGPEVEPGILPFTKETRRYTQVNFSANDFLEHYTGPDTGRGQLTDVRFTKRPLNGTLKFRWSYSWNNGRVNTYAVEDGSRLTRAQLDSLYYMPYWGFQGADTIRWQAYNGTDYTPYDTFIVIHVHHSLSEPPRLHRLDTVYCHSSGPQAVRILNLPNPKWDVAVTAMLDSTTQLPITADGFFTINPSAYTLGMHNVTVSFATGLDTVRTSVNFRVIEGIQPAFTLTAWPNPVPAGTDTVTITATYTSRFNSMRYPQFAFAWDEQFTRLLQAEGNRYTFKLAVNRLTADSTPVYVRMKARGDCFTDSVLTQSITIIREDNTFRLQPAISAVNGKMPDNRQGGGAISAYPNPFGQQFTVTGLLPDRTYILSLFDQEGRLILKRKVYHQSKADVLDNFRLGKGIYLLQVYDEQEKQVTATLKLLHI